MNVKNQGFSQSTNNTHRPTLHDAHQKQVICCPGHVCHPVIPEEKKPTNQSLSLRYRKWIFKCFLLPNILNFNILKWLFHFKSAINILYVSSIFIPKSVPLHNLFNLYICIINHHTLLFSKLLHLYQIQYMYWLHLIFRHIAKHSSNIIPYLPRSDLLSLTPQPFRLETITVSVRGETKSRLVKAGLFWFIATATIWPLWMYLATMALREGTGWNRVLICWNGYLMIFHSTWNEGDLKQTNKNSWKKLFKSQNIFQFNFYANLNLHTFLSYNCDLWSGTCTCTITYPSRFASALVKRNNSVTMHTSTSLLYMKEHWQQSPRLCRQNTKNNSNKIMNTGIFIVWFPLHSTLIEFCKKTKTKKPPKFRIDDLEMRCDKHQNISKIMLRTENNYHLCQWTDISKKEMRNLL